MRFANPQILWLLFAALALLGWFAVWATRKKQALRERFVQARLLPQLTLGVSSAREKLRWILLLLAVTTLFLALARPQWGFSEEFARQRGLDIVVAIDTSRSMLAEDLRPTRLARAKLAALDLLRAARTDRLGLVAFAGSAFLQCPLTLDDEAFRQSVDALDTQIISQGGTALSAAIQTALEAFKDENNFKTLVLFTDGEDHDSGALPAAERAAKAGLRIFTVGVGTANGEVVRVTDDNGRSSFIKDEQGNVIKSRLNETLLQQIAQTTSGAYLPLRSADAMESLYDQCLAPLPKSEISARLVRQYHERFAWPLTIAIALLMIDFLWPQRRREDFFRPSPSPGSRPGLPPPATVALLALFAVLTSAEASPNRARQHYEAGRFKNARQELQKSLEQNPEDPRLHFNLGAAAYRDGDFEQAARAFTNALTSPNLALQQQAFYNLGDALYRAGEAAEDDPGRMASWQSSVHSFESALKLNPEDKDARFNLEFVKRKLQELQQQQPQSDPSKPSDESDDSKDSEDQQQRNPENQDQPSQDNQSQTNQSPQQPKPSPRPDEEQPKPDEQQPQQNSPPKDEPSEQEPQPKPGQDQKPQDPTGKPGEQKEAQGEAAPLGQMTPQEAEQLLDAQKDEERVLIFVPPRPPQSPAKPLRDW